jgi:hypothetical protein
MPPKKKQSIEIEKTHRKPLPSFHQAVTSNRQNFLGTALIGHHEMKAFNTEFTEAAGRAEKTITETISTLLRGATLEFAYEGLLG